MDPEQFSTLIKAINDLKMEVTYGTEPESLVEIVGPKFDFKPGAQGVGAQAGGEGVATKMTDGFYWYKNSEKDPFDFVVLWFIVRICDGQVMRTGSNEEFGISELSGEWRGPLVPPE